MSRRVTSLCQTPAFGTFGSPVFIGGPSGLTDAGSPLDVTGLTRATWPSGTALPATGNPTRASAYAFMSEKVVWFDGNTALFGLSKHAAASSFSASYWFNPYTETTSALTGPQKFGCLFANSEGVTTAAPDATQQQTQFRLQYTPHPPASVAGLSMPTIHNRSLDSTYPANVGFSINSGTAPGFTLDPLDFMEGWCHVMYAHHVVGGQLVVTIFVDDTSIITNNVASHTFHGGVEYFDETFVFPWNVADFTSFDGSPCPWTLGGTQVYESDGSIANTDLTLPATGFGLIGALMEVWIAPGQYIDWSVGANRAKFHSADLAGFSWTPTDIGAAGATPTGTKPQYYFTGSPSLFPINRATGKYSAVYHNTTGATLPGGSVGKIQPYGVIPR